MIKLLQSKTVCAIHCKEEPDGFLVGMCFIHRDHQDPCILVNTETGQRYQATIKAPIGVQSNHKIVAYAIPIQDKK